MAVEQPTKAPQGFTIRRAPAAAAAAEKENLARNGAPFSATSAKAGNEARALLWHEGAEGNAVEKKKWLERSRALRARPPEACRKGQAEPGGAIIRFK